MDRSLDDTIAEHQVRVTRTLLCTMSTDLGIQRSSNRGRRGPPPSRRGNNSNYPRDGVRKVKLETNSQHYN